MTDYKSVATLIARVGLSVLFIVAGYSKLSDVAGFTGYMVSGGVPAFLAWPTIALEFLGGIAILVGFQTRLVALALAGFSLLTAILFHFVPADQGQMLNFMKNLGLAGGFLLLSANGAGAYAIDALRGASGNAAA